MAFPKQKLPISQKTEAWKQETIDYVKDKYGIEILKDDESDAIAIGTAYLLEKEE